MCERLVKSIESADDSMVIRVVSRKRSTSDMNNIARS